MRAMIIISPVCLKEKQKAREINSRDSPARIISTLKQAFYKTLQKPLENNLPQYCTILLNN